MPAKDIGIDLGTRNSLVFSTGRGIVLREPSVVIYDKDTEKIRAIGEEARQMASHLTSNMEVIWPIRGGVIVDYNVMEKMLKYFISQAMGRRAFRKPRVSISVPSGITEIERKAMEEAAYQSGAVVRPLPADCIPGPELHSRQYFPQVLPFSLFPANSWGYPDPAMEQVPLPAVRS